jgi:hypothetical protein
MAHMMNMRVVWIIIFAACVAVSVALAMGYPALSSSSNTALVGYLGLVLGAIGVLASVVGFALALEQIAKSRSASEAAELALLDIKSKLSSLSATGDLERAKLALEGLDAGIHDGKPKDARIQLVQARMAFVRIGELQLEIFADVQDQVLAVPGEIADVIDGIDSGGKDTLSKVRGLLRGHLDLASRMQIRMTRG